MGLFKKTKIFLYYKDKYYNINEDEVRVSLTKKEKDQNTIVTLPNKKKHLTKFDGKQKYTFKIEKDKVEHGISTTEVDVLYLFDYLYLKNNQMYSNILLRTPYFSIALVNNINVMFIEHSKKEGEDLQSLSLVFNGNEFIYSDFNTLYTEVSGSNKQNNVVSIMFLVLLFSVTYFLVVEEEEMNEEVDEMNYILEEETNSKEQQHETNYELKTEVQKEILSLYRQRVFLNKLFDYELTDRISKMFKFITNINIDKKSNIYDFTIVSLIMEEGFKREGNLFVKFEKDDRFEKDKKYRNGVLLSIIKKEKDFKNFFLNNDELINNHYSTKINNYLKSKDDDYRIDAISKDLKILIDTQKIDGITNQIKISYLKDVFGFRIQEISKKEVVLKLKTTIKANEVFNLIKYLRNMNIIVENLNINKVAKTINSLFFKVSSKIIIKRDGIK